MNNTELTHRSRRLLVIDDNPRIHEDIRKILCPPDTAPDLLEDESVLFGSSAVAERRLGFQIDSAFQGQEGLALVEQALADGRPYSLAFVDVRMPPGWDGIETIARLWQVYPQLQVVVCTAYSDYSWEEMRAKVGQPDGLVVLKKPFDNVEVQQLAHALTKKWQLNLQAGLKLAELESLVAKRTAELQKANTELAVSEERFSKAFHNSPIASGIQSLPDRQFVDVNERMLSLTGCRREELIGQTLSGLLMWENPGQVDQWFEALERQEPICDKETKVRTKGGGFREVLVSVSPVNLGSQPHILLLVQDVSERLLLERQLRQAQKMEAIGQLAAGVAHDFNNILTVIQGHAGLLKMQIGERNAGAASADGISRAASRAATLIRQLLMFSRKQVMQFRYLDLNVTLQNTLAMLVRLLGEHIQVDFRPATAIPSIHADASMIEQVVMNLAVNARDAMPNGGRVTITTEIVEVDREPTALDPEPRRGRFLCLSFKDTGCGMDTDVLGHIFEPFFTTKPVGKGTGLGLSTVFGIVRQHSGWLDLQSKPGRGTTFRIYFPTADAPAEVTEPVSESGLCGGRETILVAEDEEALREMVAQLLTTQGYKVLTANSGRHALEVFEKADRPIDLLMTDMVMPEGILGGELADRLKAVNPKLKVIYTSGYSPGMAGKDLSLLQTNHFLPKPYSIGKLAHFVREILDRQNN